MSHQASRETRRKTKKELRREAIQRSKTSDNDHTSESLPYYLTRDPDYNVYRNMFDSMSGSQM